MVTTNRDLELAKWQWRSEGIAGMARAMGAISRGAQKREKKKWKIAPLNDNFAPLLILNLYLG